MNDYMIRLDENGQPYIAHAGFLQRAGSAISNAGTKVRNNVKYIMKVGDPKKPRYLYTQQEVDAYLKGGRQQLTNQPKVQTQTGTKAVKNQNALKQLQRRAEDKIDSAKQTAKQLTRDAFRAVEDKVKPASSINEQALRKAQRAYEDAKDTAKNAGNDISKKASRAAEDLGDLAKQTGQEVKSKTERMREEFRKKKDEVVDKAKDVAAEARKSAMYGKQMAKEAIEDAADKIKSTEVGIEARKDLKEAEKDYESAKRSGERLQNRAAEKMNERGQNATVQDTSLYKKGTEMQKEAREDLEKAQERYDDSVMGKAEKALDKAGDKIKTKSERMREDFKKTAGAVVDKAKDIAGVDERERLRQAEKDADSSWRSAQRMKDAANKRFQDYLYEDDHDKAVNYRDRQEKLDNTANKMREDSLKDLQKAKSDYDKTLLGTIDKVKDKAGVDEKERLQKSQKEFVEAEAKKRQMLEDYRKITDEMSTFEMSGPGWQENANLLIERANKISEDIARQNEVVKEKSSEAEKAQKEYNRTLMGFVDAVKNRKKSK